MKYDIHFNMTLTPSELKKFKKFLSKGPYESVGKMIGKIDEQVAVQDMNATVATALETPPTP